jgi:hypothetical protein
MSAAAVIDMTGDSDDDAAVPAPAAPARLPKKNNASYKNDKDEDDDDDDDSKVQAVEAPKLNLKTDDSTDNTDMDEDDDDDEIQVVGATGSNALADFPHPRIDCVVHHWKADSSLTDKQKHCDHCYCYVCDIPAKECKEWTSHCVANNKERKWRLERETKRSERTGEAIRRDVVDPDDDDSVDPFRSLLMRHLLLPILMGRMGGGPSRSFGARRRSASGTPGKSRAAASREQQALDRFHELCERTETDNIVGTVSTEQCFSLLTSDIEYILFLRSLSDRPSCSFFLLTLSAHLEPPDS